ncbi:MAG: MFS transporter [Gammaproteobacteria bacterium]|nr:MFS transporter [Gammaproteobacteria bacterium]
MERLKKSTLFYYSLTDLPIAMSLFPVAVFIPRFYSNDIGIPVALVGAIIIVVRIFDVITDPLMGYISDHTHTRFGRRKPWILAATPIMMLSIYMLFMPPEGAGVVHLSVWYMLLSVAITMMLIPYYAWGAELSTDYNERSRITGGRAMAGITGSFTAQLVPGAALLLFGIGGSDVVLQLVGITMLIVMPVSVTLTLLKTPEPASDRRSVVPVLKGLKLMWGNGPFKQLVLAFMIGSIGLNITTPLYLFFIADVLNAEDQAIYMLIFFFLTSFMAVPFWVWLARRIGKHRAYLAAFFMLAFAHPFYLLLGEGDFWWMLPITLTTGFASGGFSATLPNSMKADVIDLDTLRSGENRAALFFSAWSFAQKATSSIGTAFAMFGLALFGFVAGADNGPDELFGVRFLFSTFPSIFFLAGAAIVWKYPITEERHAEIRAELEARASG